MVEPTLAADRRSQPTSVIEDDQKQRVYAAASDDFPDVDKDLVQMLHGTDIIDRQSTAAATGGRIESPLLDGVRGPSTYCERWK
jgi:hypothetical protein